MKSHMYALDNERHYCSGSVVGDYADGLTNQQLLDSINSKKEVHMEERRVYVGSDLDYYGAHRWNVLGERLYQTSDDEVWYSGVDGEQYTGEDVYSYNPTEVLDMPKCRTKLNAEEQSWMAAHEQYLEPVIGDSVEECVRYDEEINDGAGYAITKTVYTTENTTMPKDEVGFLRSMVWCIGHAPKRAIEICKKHKDKEWFTLEKKHWIYELIKEDNTPKFKWVLYLMMNAKKYLASHEKPIMDPKDYEDVYENFSWKITDSYKYPGQKFVQISFTLNGKKHVISKVTSCSNWLTDLDSDSLNKAIDLARKEYVASK